MDEIKQYESLFRGRKILFIMPELSTGGAERVIVTIIKYLDKSKYDPVLLILNTGKNPLDLNEIGCEVELVNLGVERVRSAPLKLINTIKEIKPDTVLSTLGYLNEVISLIIPFLPKHIQFNARESSVVSKRNKADKNAWLHNWIYKRLMKRFNAIVCQSEEMKQDLESAYNIQKEKLIVIDNPIDKEYIIRRSKEPCDIMKKGDVNVIAVGSLKKVKNYDLLLDEAKSKKDNIKYWVLGEGTERSHLEIRIKEEKLNDKVFLLGHQTNPWKFMLRADEFWQKSHWEGNSNALKEWKVIQSKK